MNRPQRKPSRADVAQSLRELHILFSGIKKKPDRNSKGLREQAFGEAGTLIKGVTK